MSLHLVITHHARDRIQARIGDLDPLIDAIRGGNYQILHSKRGVELIIPGLGTLLGILEHNCLIIKTFIYNFFKKNQRMNLSQIYDKIRLLSFKI